MRPNNVVFMRDFKTRQFESNGDKLFRVFFWTAYLFTGLFLLVHVVNWIVR